jgi:LysR family hydrogen peroxide-inducible transcriptional activator
MPHVAIRTYDEGICYLPFAPPAPSRTIGLVWRKTSHRGDLLKRLGELVQTLSWE